MQSSEALKLDERVVVCQLCDTVLKLDEPVDESPKGAAPTRVTWRPMQSPSAAFGCAFATVWAFVFFRNSYGWVLASLPAYFLLAQPFSHTSAVVDGGVETVKQRPFPACRDARFDRRDLEKLNIVENRTQHRGGVRIRYAVTALLKDGTVKSLGTSFDQEQRADFVKAELTRMLAA